MEAEERGGALPIRRPAYGSKGDKRVADTSKSLTVVNYIICFLWGIGKQIDVPLYPK